MPKTGNENATEIVTSAEKIKDHLHRNNFF